MKKHKTILLSLVLCMCLSGCNLWMDGYYHHAAPHLQEQQSKDQEAITVSGYMELRDAVEQLVEECAQKSIIYTRGIAPKTIESYMPMVIAYIKNNNPIGAYALDDITYDSGTNAGVQAVALEFSYTHLRSEILQIKHTQSMTEAVSVITNALNNCDAGVLLQVQNYQNMDLTQMIQDYVDSTPWKCMEMPQVSEIVYPDQGDERLIELSFTYQTSRDKLRTMQETVSTVFSSAELYVRGDAADIEKYAQLYSFLMERYDYVFETSLTPPYSLLRHGVGDSKAFATVYAGMCRKAGLNCAVVTGSKNGEPRYWNMIPVDGVYYHLDLVSCVKNGGFQLRTSEEMNGYVWDYSEYPDKTDSGEYKENK